MQHQSLCACHQQYSSNWTINRITLYIIRKSKLGQNDPEVATLCVSFPKHLSPPFTQGSVWNCSDSNVPCSRRKVAALDWQSKRQQILRHTADILQLSAHIHGNYHCTPCQPCQPCRICTKVAAKQHQFCTSVLCLTCAEHEGLSSTPAYPCWAICLSLLRTGVPNRGARGHLLLSLLIFLI